MSQHNDHPPELSSHDMRLLDALIESGFRPDLLGELGDEDASRIEVLMQLFGVLEDYPVDDAEDTLLHATLARIDKYEAERQARMGFDRAEEGQYRSRGRLRVPDFVTVAAVLLIVASISLPLMRSMRQRSIDQTCANNLRLVGYAFGSYAADNDNMLPVARAGIGSSWDSVANVLNLAPLVEGQYCERGHMSCPGHDDLTDQSYSYQWQLEGAQLYWGVGPVTVVLGDRNPLIDAARQGATLSPLSISSNHPGRGQNVLTSDGTAMWLEAPVVGRGDNIWLPHGRTRLHQGDRPRDARDVFLAH